MSTNVEKLKDFISYWIFRYELATNLNMAEPWEKCLVNVLMLFLLTILGYLAYSVVPPLTGTLFSLATSLVPVAIGEDVALPLAAAAATPA